jgi:hypothetical protein
MMKSLDSARRVLDNFYTTIYRLCEEYNETFPKICAIVAFDCAALFTRNQNESDRLNGLLKMLAFIKQANRHFIRGNPSPSFMTTCSIAYGDFDYEDRAELADIRKNYLFGRPYLNAVLDQKKGKPKMKAGECRLLTKRLTHLGQSSNNSLLSFVLRRGNHRYFYWMLNNPRQQHDFDREYLVAYKPKKSDNYPRMVQVLQTYINRASLTMH